MVELNVNQIFIYPTDTIYGIGCNAEDEKLVSKIREIKNRDDKPFSIIAPSVDWILENFETSLNEIDKFLPGKYTLLLKKKNSDFMDWVSDNDRIGVRIPDNDFTKKLQKEGKPIITTSVNISGEPFATSIEEVDKNILEKVDEVFDYGKLSGSPSTLVIDGKKIERKQK
jgi:L-threonylcarbamoyladenylate synthase